MYFAPCFNAVKEVEFDCQSSMSSTIKRKLNKSKLEESFGNKNKVKLTDQ